MGGIEHLRLRSEGQIWDYAIRPAKTENFPGMVYFTKAGHLALFTSDLC